VNRKLSKQGTHRQCGNEITGGCNSSVSARMPGLVVNVEVSVGDEVDIGSGVVILEAMKMENELR
jgi:pyruvate carboxylase subunit B